MKLSNKQFIDNVLGSVLIFLNVVIARIFGFILRLDHSLKKSPDCIIITKMLGLGSLLMAADAILAIKKRYPDARLVLVCSSLIEKETKALALFDEVWAIDDRSFWVLVKSAFTTLVKTWKFKRLWTVNLEVYSRLSTIFSLWTLARNRFGFYFNEVKFRYALNTHHVYFNPMHLAYDNYEQMALEMDAPVKDIYRFPVPGGSQSLQYIAINNNCSELAKERIIPDDILITSILEIAAVTTLGFVLIGSKADHDYNEQLMQHPRLQEIRGRMINIAGKYPFLEFLNFLKKECAMLLTIDSGPLHFAYRLDMPVVSVWGPTHPETRVPPAFKHEILYLAVHCSPCVHHTDILPCGGDNFCMKNINAALLSHAIKHTLQIHYERKFDVS